MHRDSFLSLLKKLKISFQSKELFNPYKTRVNPRKPSGVSRVELKLIGIVFY